MDLSAFTTAALRTGTIRNDPRLRQLAIEGKHVMLQQLQHGAESLRDDQKQSDYSQVASRRVSLFATNEAILMMGLFEHAMAQIRKGSFDPNTVYNSIERHGFAIVQAAGPTAFLNDIGWWMMRYIFIRIVSVFGLAASVRNVIEVIDLKFSG